LPFQLTRKQGNMELEEYVKTYLPSALESILQSHRVHELPNLSIYEKAIIFAYTDSRSNQHQILNQRLWETKGLDVNEFGLFLETILDKLEPYRDMVFRGVQESHCDVARYIKAHDDKTIVTEYHFLSASKLVGVAQGFGRILFRIYGKNAKIIEKVSKFEREQEVLFKSNTSFKVVKVTNNGFSTIITLKEI
jgi:NAD:arginine ADP-ribosyltransferase